MRTTATIPSSSSSSSSRAASSFRQPVGSGLFLLVAGGLLTGMLSCNGDDGDTSGNEGVASGTISGFGSIIVNEIEFLIDDATVFDAGEDESEDDLDVGQVVTVEGVFSGPVTATATRVASDEILEGPVTALFADGIEVAGRVVVIEDESMIPSLGNVVEVHGFLAAGGQILATLVEVEEAVFLPGVSEIEIEGRLAELDPDAMRFRLGGRLLVDFSTAELGELPPGGLDDGLFVEAVSGQDLIDEGDHLVLVAERVEVLPERAEVVREGERLELEGIVTSEPGADPINLRFAVGRRVVVTTVATEFRNGTAADLAIDQRLEVEGRLNSFGELIAQEIEIRPRSDIRIEGEVQALGGNAIRLVRIDVAVTRGTRIEDESDEQVRPFRFSDIEAGDWLEVRGFESPGGFVVANSVERENPEDQVVLRGPATVPIPNTLQILRVPIDVSFADFENEAGEDITRDAFFMAFSTGPRLVKVQGEFLVDGSIRASQAELED